MGRRARTRQSRRRPSIATLKEGLGAAEAFVGNKAGDAKAALPKAAKKVEAVYTYPLPEPRDDGADERDRASGPPERCEVWTPDPERRGRAGRRRRGGRAAAGAMRGLQDAARRRLRPARRGHDWVRQAVAIAKELPGTPVKLLWSREEDMLHGRYHPITQCKLTAGLDAQGNLDRAAHAHLRPVDHRRHRAADAAGRRAIPVVFQGLNAGRCRRRLRLQRPEPADRPRDAQPACAAGLLARRERQPERRSTWNASSTRWRWPPARIRWSFVARC